MKILVMSDSHGNYAQALKAHQLAGAVDHVVHLGDGAEDARLLEDVLEIPVIRVAGNCDTEMGLPAERCITFGESRFLLTHGNRYQVKSGLALLKRKGTEVGADVVLYGHTHQAAIEKSDELLLVNPGELKSGQGSYAIITVAEGEASARILKLGAR